MPWAPTELRKFQAAGRAIQAAASIGVEEWAVGEGGVILKLWAGNVAIPNVNAVERRARNRVLKNEGLTQGKITINSGVRGEEGRVWIRAKNGKYRLAGMVAHNAGSFSPENLHFSPDQWADQQSATGRYQGKAGMIAMARRTIGLARQSIIQIADTVGIALERVVGGGIGAGGVAQARGAVASDGKVYQNGTGTRQKTATSFALEFVNTYPKIQQAHVDTALINALGSRQAFHSRNFEAGVFKSVEKTARAYPYIEVKR